MSLDPDDLVTGVPVFGGSDDDRGTTPETLERAAWAVLRGVLATDAPSVAGWPTPYNLEDLPAEHRAAWRAFVQEILDGRGAAEAWDQRVAFGGVEAFTWDHLPADLRLALRKAGERVRSAREFVAPAPSPRVRVVPPPGVHDPRPDGSTPASPKPLRKPRKAKGGAS